MRPEIRSMEGIVLRAGKGREGGRLVSVFTREMGFLRLGVSRQALSRYGTGLMLPFAHIRFTGAFYPDYSIMTQYEGGLLFDMMAIPYEEMSEWYYVIELASLLFPEEEADEEAFDTLLLGGRAAKTRNRRVTAFVTAVKLLAIAGFDPAQEEPAGEHHLSSGALSLLAAFRDYRWEKPFEGTIPSSLFNEAAEYLDRFITEYCGLTLHTAGAFSDKNTKF